MVEPVEFEVEITLARAEVFDVVARCEEAVERAETVGEPELALLIEAVRRFLLGRLTGTPGGSMTESASGAGAGALAERVDVDLAELDVPPHLVRGKLTGVDEVVQMSKGAPQLASCVSWLGLGGRFNLHASHGTSPNSLTDDRVIA